MRDTHIGRQTHTERETHTHAKQQTTSQLERHTERDTHTQKQKIHRYFFWASIDIFSGSRKGEEFLKTIILVCKIVTLD